MADVQVLGRHRFRVQIRRNGVSQDKTFETYREAAAWRSVVEGKITGDEIIDQKVARSTTVAKACTWMIDGNHIGKDARNIAAKLRYWQDSKFAHWSLVALHDWDLIEWRRHVLDEENAEDGTCGPDGAEHRRSFTGSTPYRRCFRPGRAHTRCRSTILSNPV
jgi:hypothetical protein